MLLKFLKAQITGFASRLEFCKRHLLEYLRISKPQMSVLCVFECVCFFQTQQSTTTMRRALSIDSTRCHRRATSSESFVSRRPTEATSRCFPNRRYIYCASSSGRNEFADLCNGHIVYRSEFASGHNQNN